MQVKYKMKDGVNIINAETTATMWKNRVLKKWSKKYEENRCIKFSWKYTILGKYPQYSRVF